ncbi:MAG: transcription antitermination factor NusB [Bacteroidales bacterium]|nr:transcription antitermination factor NusB [Bacteroidales bacterium]
MLSRRHLRIKVLQALYSFYQSDNKSLKEGEEYLRESIASVHELFIHQLSFLEEVVDFARAKIEDAKLKYLPTEADLNPNTRFIDNRFIQQLVVNKSYLVRKENLKISWAEEPEMIRRFYIHLKEFPEYIEYMEADECSYMDDKNFLIKIVKKYVNFYELLEVYYEEKSVFWADDFDTANMMVMKTIKSWEENWDEYAALPGIYNTKGKDDPKEDEKFTYSLYRHVMLDGKEYDEYIQEFSKNWEAERIALMDRIILKMALAEMIHFPSIPIKVSINECIEIAKNYSTDKSKIFINGMLDNLITKLENEKKIKKIGRGLKE